MIWLLRTALSLTCATLIALVLGLAGRCWWVLDLFSHFRLQYAVALGTLAMVLSALRWHKVALLAFAGSCAATVSIVGYTGGPSRTVHAAASTFRFATFNAFYLNQDVVRIGAGLEAIGADVVTLQELDVAKARALARHLPSYPHVYFDAAHRYGAVIFSRWPIIRQQTVELTPAGSRAAQVVLDWHGKAITVIGTHLYWPFSARNVHLRDAALQRLARLAATIHGPVLIGGDFNITVWSPRFQDALAGSSLSDCARSHGLVPTWPTFFAPLSIRIDHCLASQDWQVVSVRTGPSLGSDHYPAITELTLRQ